MQVRIATPDFIPLIDYTELKPLKTQGKDSKLKEEELKASLKTNGFFIPFFYVSIEGEKLTIDGNGRLEFCLANKVTNENGDFLLPGIEVDISHIEENEKLKKAHELLLHVESKYNPWLNKKAFDDFKMDLNFDANQMSHFIEWKPDTDWEPQKFQPNLEPTKGYSPVDANQIDKAGEKIKDNIKLERKMMECICPNCAEEFSIQIP